MATETMKNRHENTDLYNILFAVALLMGFIFVVSLAIYFIKDHYGLACSCNVSLPIVIAILTSLGVFVGILTYYFFSKSFTREKTKLYGSIEKTLNFLDTDEKKILLALIQKKGASTQNTLSKETGLDAVKLHRRLTNLEKKGITQKTKQGMTNVIKLNTEYAKLFIQRE